MVLSKRRLIPSVVRRSISADTSQTTSPVVRNDRPREPMSDKSDNTHDVRESMLVGVRWVAGARAVIEIIGLASSVVLARLIAPPEFGQAVVALIVATLASIMVSNAFASLLVQQDV